MVRCGRCGRLLTDPQSITLGFGPKCRKVLREEIALETSLHQGLDQFVLAPQEVP